MAKISYSDRKLISACLGLGWRGCECAGHEGILWALYRDCGDGYMDLYICQNSFNGPLKMGTFCCM